jgi:hypothetical protein
VHDLGRDDEDAAGRRRVVPALGIELGRAALHQRHGPGVVRVAAVAVRPESGVQRLDPFEARGTPETRAIRHASQR